MKPKDGGPGKPPKTSSPSSKSLIPKKPFKEPMSNAQTDANNAFTDRRERRQMRTAVGGVIGGTLAALANTPGGRKAIKKGAKAVVGVAKKIGPAVKNLVQRKGEFISNPNTGKMERAPKVKSAKPMSEKAVRNIYKAK